VDARMEEKTYRQILDDTFARIDRAFESVDPDVAEVSISQGALTITFDAMHDDAWTERARAGHESQMRKLDALLAAQGKGVRS